jgi:beta-lactam-binding protein with PASTA domain/tRNA A-37 threonylcarbamoyl transferase component Bud32
VFNNRYRIESRLGNGGMAIVYGGTDTLLRRRVAVKVLREQYAADDDFVKRFSYEAQSAAKLSHPNIVSVYDFGTENDAYFIVMELVDGETLGAQIASARTIPEGVAIDYAIQLASGLAYAHRQGLLHRDIKPANVLITKDDVVKISDFGIARAVSEHTMGVTQPGMVMGSVYYLSPEQAQGFDSDETSDLYSLGVVLYQMLAGTLPFTGDTPVAVALKHVSEPVPAVEDAAPGVSPALASIVTRLLQKNPRDRFGSATELAAALRDARERPTVTQTVAAGARSDDPTTVMSAVGIPPPPPRRSAAPDRPVEVIDDAVRRRDQLRWVIWFALLLVAVAGGYALWTLPLFGPAKTITVADYTGQMSTSAQQRLAALHLHSNVTTEDSSTVAPDRVIRQTPVAGTKLAADEVVTLVVSSGAPLVQVPDIKGFTRADAERQLTGAKFRTKIFGKFSPDVPKDTVIDVNPGVGSHAREGSVVSLTVSKGQEPASVPPLVGMQVDAARTLLNSRGLKMDVVQQTESAQIPENTVASQLQDAGTQVDRGSTVQVTVSTGAPQTGVPDVGGKSPDDARAALVAAGLDAIITYNVDPANAGGNVTAQNPAPNATARRGSKVTLVISVPGTVPDVTGQSLDDAKAAIIKSGYAVGNIADSPDGNEGAVVRTEPEANKELRPGESVVIYYHPRTAR